ncbi:MAG: MFS transporter [Chlamydiae bacterium]|nr:MFS transporter [Chlamydiota bacterium]
MRSSSFRKVLPYALVVFFGYMGFAMPLPMLPEMFLDSEVGILPASYSHFLKTFLLGVVMSAYPLGQLIGAPILGKCSDVWGRKKIILYSLLGSMVGYILTALATDSQQVLWIFSGLFVCGLCEGNVAIAQSVVADLAHASGESENKVSHLGWINLFACFAFVIGPILGGQLSDSSLVSWFRFSTPFWIAACMTLLGVGVILGFSEETKVASVQAYRREKWKTFYRSIRNSPLYKLFLVNFLLAMGYYSYFRFFPVHAESRYSFDAAMLGYTIAYGSLTFAFFSAFCLKKIAKWFPPQRAVGFFSLLLSVSLLFALWPSSPWSVLGTMLPINLSLAVIMTYAAVLISDASPAESQGRMFGVLTAVQVLAEILTGLIGGVLAGYAPYLPMLMGVGFLLLGAWVLFSPSIKRQC